MKKLKSILCLLMLFVAFSTNAQVVSKPDVPAEFPGGQSAMFKFLAQNVRYPAAAIENMIEGKVVVRVTVVSDGTLSDPTILRDVDPDLEAEAVRVVMLMPAWTPATVGGAPVDSYVTIPVNFKL